MNPLDQLAEQSLGISGVSAPQTRFFAGLSPIQLRAQQESDLKQGWEIEDRRFQREARGYQIRKLAEEAQASVVGKSAIGKLQGLDPVNDEEFTLKAQQILAQHPEALADRATLQFLDLQDKAFQLADRERKYQTQLNYMKDREKLISDRALAVAENREQAKRRGEVQEWQQKATDVGITNFHLALQAEREDAAKRLLRKDSLTDQEKEALRQQEPSLEEAENAIRSARVAETHHKRLMDEISKGLPEDVAAKLIVSKENEPFRISEEGLAAYRRKEAVSKAARDRDEKRWNLLGRQIAALKSSNPGASSSDKEVVSEVNNLLAELQAEYNSIGHRLLGDLPSSKTQQTSDHGSGIAPKRGFKSPDE